MYQNANDAYCESRILSADPVELVCLLYQGAIDAVRDARRHLAAGEIAERSRSIGKASAILMELLASLEREKGGEVGERLAALYAYLNGRVLEANLRQEDGPLSEALALLTTLAEAWDGIRRQAAAPPQPEIAAYTPMVPPESGAYSSHAWSF